MVVENAFLSMKSLFFADHILKGIISTYLCNSCDSCSEETKKPRFSARQNKSV